MLNSGFPLIHNIPISQIKTVCAVLTSDTILRFLHLNSLSRKISAFIFSALFFYSTASDCAENSVSPQLKEIAPPPAPELQVKPFRKFGTGKADASAAAINPPDGLAFTRDGFLVATDALNHRLQIFDPVTGKHLGHIGDNSLITGEIVNVILLADDSLLVSDETSNQAYHFLKLADSPINYKASGAPLFKEDGFKKLTGLACDSMQRIYAVDGKLGDVRRYFPDFKADPAWKLQRLRPDNKPLITRSEGIAIDEKSGTLFVTDEWNGIIHVFDMESGKWTGKSIGRRLDALTGEATEKSVFQLSVEGLAVIDDYLLAIDEGTENSSGHLLIFYLRSPAVYETGIKKCRRRQKEKISDGLLGWIGSYNSPDAVAVFPGNGNMGAMIAVADQGSYQVFVYLWKDVLEAIQKAKIQPR